MWRDFLPIIGRQYGAYGVPERITAGRLRIGEHRWQLQLESVNRGSGFATPKRMRRARDSVAAVEAALPATRRTVA